MRGAGSAPRRSAAQRGAEVVTSPAGGRFPRGPTPHPHRSGRRRRRRFPSRPRELASRRRPALRSALGQALCTRSLALPRPCHRRFRAGEAARARSPRARRRAAPSLARSLSAGSLQTLPCSRPPSGGPAPAAGAAQPAPASPRCAAPLRSAADHGRCSAPGTAGCAQAASEEVRRRWGRGWRGTGAAPCHRRRRCPPEAAAAPRGREGERSPRRPPAAAAAALRGGGRPAATSPTTSSPPGAGPARGSRPPGCREAVLAAGAERERVRSGREARGIAVRCGGARSCRGPAAPVTLRNDLPRPARRGAPLRALAAAPRAEPGPRRCLRSGEGGPGEPAGGRPPSAGAAGAAWAGGRASGTEQRWQRFYRSAGVKLWRG